MNFPFALFPDLIRKNKIEDVVLRPMSSWQENNQAFDGDGNNACYQFLFSGNSCLYITSGKSCLNMALASL